MRRAQQVDDLPALEERLDPVLWEQVESLLSVSVLDNQVRKKLADSTLRLREEYLRQVFAVEAEDGGSTAAVTRLGEEGTEKSDQLKEVFTQKDRESRGTRRWK